MRKDYFSHDLRIESAFAPYVGFGVLMTSILGTNEIYCSFSPLKVLKEFI